MATERGRMQHGPGKKRVHLQWIQIKELIHELFFLLFQLEKVEPGMFYHFPFHCEGEFSLIAQEQL